MATRAPDSSCMLVLLFDSIFTMFFAFQLYFWRMFREIEPFCTQAPFSEGGMGPSAEGHPWPIFIVIYSTLVLKPAVFGTQFLLSSIKGIARIFRPLGAQNRLKPRENQLETRSGARKTNSV